MDKFFENLKHQAEENPVIALAAGAALITSVSRLISASSNSRNSKAWAKEVDRRVKASKKQ